MIKDDDNTKPPERQMDIFMIFDHENFGHHIIKFDLVMSGLFYQLQNYHEALLAEMIYRV